MFRSMLGMNTNGAGFKKIIMKPEIEKEISPQLYSKCDAAFRCEEIFTWQLNG